MSLSFYELPLRVRSETLMPVRLDLGKYGTLNVGAMIYAGGEPPMTYLGKYPHKDSLVFEDADSRYLCISKADFVQLLYLRAISLQAVEEV